jgi:hypothetical protein
MFGSVPKSHTQMGSLTIINASEKFSRLGTFKWNLSLELEAVINKKQVVFREIHQKLSKLYL